MRTEIKNIAIATLALSIFSLITPLWHEFIWALLGAALVWGKRIEYEISKEKVKEGIVLFGKALGVSVFAILLLSIAGLNDLESVSIKLGVYEGIIALFIAPIAEELLFRVGVIERLGVKYGVIVSTILFSAVHWGYGLAQAYGAFAIGLLFALEYAKKREIVPLIVAHVLINALSLATMITFK